MAARASLLLAFVLSGCFPPGEGEDPDAAAVYFPVGLALDAGAKHLFIVNSDFDLQYNSGTILSWDVAKLRTKVPVTCATDADCKSPRVCDLSLRSSSFVPSGWCVDVRDVDGVATVSAPCLEQPERARDQQLLYPGRCEAIRSADVATTSGDAGTNSVRIGAFATDALYRQSPLSDDVTERGRLFVPVRGDATLHWIDVQEGLFACGQSNSEDGKSCDADHRSGDDPVAENTRLMRLHGEPFGVDADASGSVLMVTNQASGAVGLFTNDWNGSTRYQYTQEGLPQRPIGVAALPEPKIVAARGLPHLPGFLVSYRNAPYVHLIRAFLDEGADPARPYTKVIGQSTVTLNSSGADQRGIAVDSAARAAAETACAERFGLDAACVLDTACASADAGYVTCVSDAAAIPLDIFVASRAPASLLRGTSRPVIDDLPSSDVPAFHSTQPIGLGPSRVIVGEILNAAGERERRIFVLSFDSRRIVIYDPARNRIDADIVTGRGPQALAIDVGVDEDGRLRALGYIAHFTDSYIGVVSLDQRHPATYGTIIATVADPNPPRASK